MRSLVSRLLILPPRTEVEIKAPLLEIWRRYCAQIASLGIPCLQHKARLFQHVHPVAVF
jgi:hypothetical protein